MEDCKVVSRNALRQCHAVCSQLVRDFITRANDVMRGNVNNIDLNRFTVS